MFVLYTKTRQKLISILDIFQDYIAYMQSQYTLIYMYYYITLLVFQILNRPLL